MRTIKLEMPDRVFEQIKRVQQRTKAENLSEVFRRALALYDLATEQGFSDEELARQIVNRKS